MTFLLVASAILFVTRSESSFPVAIKAFHYLDVPWFIVLTLLLAHDKFSRQVVTGREKNSRERARGDKEAVATAQGIFLSPYTGSLQVASPINSPVLVSKTSSGPASSSSNVPVSGTMYRQSAVDKSNEQSRTYLDKKSGELTENPSIIQTQIKSATDQLEIVRNQYEQASSKANGRRAGKLCTRCHQPGHYRARCSNPTCMDMNNCGVSKKHPESKNEIMKLRKLIKDLQKKEGILVMDSRSHLVAGVSSSGISFKHPGRVGDSPLPGSGLYADNEIGAAAATGDGDKMMRFCPAFHVVQLMRQGHSPQESCELVIKEAQQKARTATKPFQMALIAINKKGDFGAAGTVTSFKDERHNTLYTGFPFVVWTEEMSESEIRVRPPLYF